MMLGGAAPRNQLMLMMLGTVLDARTPQNQLAPQSQLVLMMLGGAGPAKPADAHDAGLDFGAWARRTT